MKEAMSDILKKIGYDNVYVKGFEKMRFLQKYILQMCDLDFVPSIKKLLICQTDCCEIKHAMHCTMRKVHALKKYIDDNRILLC